MKTKTLLVAAAIILFPYLFNRNLNRDVANFAISHCAKVAEAYEEKVNLIVYSSIWNYDSSDFTLPEKAENPNYNLKEIIVQNNDKYLGSWEMPIVAVDTYQFSWFSVSYVSIIEGTASVDYTEYRICGILKWLYVSREITGMA
jgi:hypothetical protein